MNHFRKLNSHTLILKRSYQITQSRAAMLAWIGSMFEPGVKKTGESIFDHTVEDISGSPIELSSFKGKKAYLVVNVASK